MSEPSDLSMVFPAYNEARRLPQTLDKLRVFFGEFTRTFEVLIVVEQSGDGTLEIASAAKRRQENFLAIASGPLCNRRLQTLGLASLHATQFRDLVPKMHLG